MPLPSSLRDWPHAQFPLRLSQSNSRAPLPEAEGSNLAFFSPPALPAHDNDSPRTLLGDSPGSIHGGLSNRSADQIHATKPRSDPITATELPSDLVDGIESRSDLIDATKPGSEPSDATHATAFSLIVHRRATEDKKSAENTKNKLLAEATMDNSNRTTTALLGRVSHMHICTVGISG